MFITEDVENPGAWRREPYESQFRTWARELASRQQFVGVRCGARTTLLLADSEVELK